MLVRRLGGAELSDVGRFADRGVAVPGEAGPHVLEVVSAHPHLVVLGSEQGADLPHPMQLVLRVVGEPGRERVQRLGGPQLQHLGDDQAAAEAAGEVGPHWDVGNERRTDRLAHPVTHRLDRVAVAPRVVRVHLRRCPIARLLEVRPGQNGHTMRWSYLLHALEQRVRRRHHARPQIGVEAAVVDLRWGADGKECLDLRGECDPAGDLAVVERQDAQAVTHQVGGVGAEVVGNEGELTLESFDEADALEGEAGHQHLGVTAVAERIVQLGP